MKLEVGKKYTDGSSIVEIKFIDYENCAWGLDQILRSRFIESRNVDRWQEVTDKPDPGEGWRLLEVGEKLQDGDQFYNSGADWVGACLTWSGGVVQKGSVYRRRIAPQYVPYTWDDRDELRGRWFRRKAKGPSQYERLACFFCLIDGHFYVNSIRNDELLNECEWLDGTPCGKVVV